MMSKLIHLSIVLLLVGLATSDILDNEVTDCESGSAGPHPKIGGDADGDVEPEALYLKKWSQKFTELNEIPPCRKVPKETDEERKINSTCPKTGKNLICSNIFLFTVVRDSCKAYFDNEETFRQGVKDVINEVGLGNFATIPFKEIYKMLEVKTGVEIPTFIKMDVQELAMDVLQELADGKWKPDI